MQSIIGSEGPIVQEGEGTDLHEDSGSCHNCARIMHREEENARPTAAQLIRLWQIFLDRVHPLTKILHAPSFQPYVVDATGNFGGQPWNIQALLFAICQIAIISLDEEECMALMGCTRDDAVRRFSSAGRSILHRHSFLRNNDLTTLQAVVLQMVGGVFRSCHILLLLMLANSQAAISPWPQQPACLLDPEWTVRPSCSGPGCPQGR